VAVALHVLRSRRTGRRRAGISNNLNRRLHEQASILDAYYIPTRYPNGLLDGIPATAYNREAAERATRLAQAASEFVGQRLKP
jgi:HEPN domain-containing protein